MPFFVTIESELKVRAGDKTRIDASKSFGTQDMAAVQTVEIRPTAADSFIDLELTADQLLDKASWYLDWVFSAPGAVVPTVRLTLTDATTHSGSGAITVVSSVDDRVFASDQDLVSIIPDVTKYIRAGRATFLDVHREAARQIFDWLDEKGFVNSSGNKFVQADLTDVEEVRRWATYTALRIIFDGLSNAVDDIFDKKARGFEKQEIAVRQRAILRLDVDDDGIVDEVEGLNISSGTMYRR